MTESKHSHNQENCREALLLMDLQVKLLSSIENQTSLLRSNTVLLKSAQMFEIHTIITEQVPEKLGKTHMDIAAHFINQTVIEKDSFSAFGSPDFVDLIEVSKINKLIIAGIETPICVFLTAIDAIRENINVSIISDCVSCRIKEDGKRCLDQLSHYGVEIIPLETFLFRKLKSSNHILFKEVSGLVKSRV